jgi:flagellar biosynthesis protein FlhA
MAVIPGFPTLPFLLMSAGVGGLGWNLRRREAAPAVTLPPVALSERESVQKLLRGEPLAIEVGRGVVTLVDAGQGGTLLKRIAGVRRQLASELGFVLPPVRVTDNLSLKAREYVVLLKGAEISRYELQPESELAINPGQAQGKIEGVPGREPAFGLPAIWVPPSEVDKARLMGYTVVDAANVVATHLSELIRTYAHEILTRQDTNAFLDRLRDENPKLIEDLVPKLLPLSLLQRVLQNLLRERVSIKDGVTILEALAEGGSATKNPTLLTEIVRQAMTRAIVKPYLNERGDLPGYLVDPRIEQTVQNAVEHNEISSRLSLAPASISEIVEKVKGVVGQLQGPAILICGAAARFAMRQMIESELPLLAVVSHGEIPPNMKVISLGVVR